MVSSHSWILHSCWSSVTEPLYCGCRGGVNNVIELDWMLQIGLLLLNRVISIVFELKCCQIKVNSHLPLLKSRKQRRTELSASFTVRKITCGFGVQAVGAGSLLGFAFNDILSLLPYSLYKN
jgi:hypothetical protein